MKMFGLIFSCGNSMNIDIKNLFHHRMHIRQSGFFARLAPGGAEHIGIFFDVAAELDPQVEFAMVGEQGMLAFLIQDPGRAGKMPDRQAPIEKSVMLIDKAFDLQPHSFFVRIQSAMRADFQQYGVSIHLKILILSGISRSFRQVRKQGLLKHIRIVSRQG